MEIVNMRGVNFSGSMPYVTGAESLQRIPMKTSSQRHMISASVPVQSDNAAGGFASALADALGGVERLDNNSKKLNARAVYEPDSVNVHEVVIAAEKARLALNLTKTLSDGLVRAYKELTAGR